MTDLRYRLVVLTHGRCEPLAETMQSFHEYVTPEPADVVVHYDGVGPSEFSFGKGGEPDERTAHFLKTWRKLLGIDGFQLSGLAGQQGFCSATRSAWAAGAAEEVGQPIDYIFYLEHDFRFLRGVDLTELAIVLEGEQELAQIALARDATADERSRGGDTIFGHPRDLFEEREFIDLRTGEIAARKPYLVHSVYFSTNPSLMRRRFMIENPWPDYPQFCEGRFGIDLIARDYSFAIWGDGEPWVSHIGKREGHGY